MPKRIVLASIGFHLSALVSMLFACVLFTGLKDCLLLTGESAGPSSDPGIAFANAMVHGTALTAWTVVSVPVLWAIAAECVPWGLRKRKYGAWVFGIILAGIQLIAGIQLLLESQQLGPLAFQPWAPAANVLTIARWFPLPLAALALWGLLDAGTVIAFRPRAAGDASMGWEGDNQ